MTEPKTFRSSTLALVQEVVDAGSAIQPPPRRAMALLARFPGVTVQVSPAVLRYDGLEG